MDIQQLVALLTHEHDVEISTMMGSPCLRYKGKFFSMWFEKADSLIIKLPAQRVDDLIAEGNGNEFNYTKKRFKEWVLIPRDLNESYGDYLNEALAYAKSS